MIDAMILTAGPGAALAGTGDWRWLDDRADTSLPPDIRLAEPAYLTGFGLSDRPNARRIDAAEVLAPLSDLLAQAPAFRPFSA